MRHFLSSLPQAIIARSTSYSLVCFHHLATSCHLSCACLGFGPEGGMQVHVGAGIARPIAPLGAMSRSQLLPRI